MRALLLAGVALLGWSCRAQAVVTQYRVQGLFADGETLSGAFYVDSAVKLPDGLYGSTLTVSGLGAYSAFLGAAPATGSRLDIQFAGQGILALSVMAEYNAALHVLSEIRTGPLEVGAVYGLGIRDTFLTTGLITIIAEPVSMALLGTGVAVAVAARRRLTRPIAAARCGERP